MVVTEIECQEKVTGWVLFKGQTKLKWFFESDVSSKKWTNEFDFTTMIPQVDLFSFVFWKKLKTSKRHFEINWPLGKIGENETPTLDRHEI